jgi:hypothetical protein
MERTPGKFAKARSSTAVTPAAMVSALAPGKSVVRLIVGTSICGTPAIGSCVKLAIPKKSSASMSNKVAIGRPMNHAEKFN